MTIILPRSNAENVWNSSETNTDVEPTIEPITKVEPPGGISFHSDDCVHSSKGINKATHTDSVDPVKLKRMQENVHRGECAVDSSHLQWISLVKSKQPSWIEKFTFRSTLARALYPKKKSVFRKTFGLIGTVFTLPAASVSSLVEVFFNVFQSARFIAIQEHKKTLPEQSLELGAIEPKDLNAISANIACMPVPIAMLNKMAPAPERIHLLAKHITQEGCPSPDFICLQESFVENTTICDALVQKGYSVVGGIRGFGLNAGLVIASKLPMEKAAFYQYQAAGGEDWWAKKGVLMFSTTVRNETVIVANTHFQAKYGPRYAAIRYKQFGELKKSIQLFQEKIGKENSKVMIMGDFNFAYQRHEEQVPGEIYEEEERKYIQFASKKAGYLDYTNDPSRPGLPTINSWLGPPTQSKDAMRLPLKGVAYDAFFGKKLGADYRVSVSTLDDPQGLSDHAAIKISLKQRTN